MKKIIVLMLLLLLCASLTACGHMDGAEAAALYPDILGNWGTDYFGEEFALSLQADGTCTVLDNPGTWTLDKKLSSQTQVTLTAKTEPADYSIRLDRVPADTQDAFNPVHLVIMDAKQEVVVYEKDVFTAEGNVVSHELALQTVPELIGEWGSQYWHEESALTIREDGTCTLLRQPGRWCLRSDGTAQPSVILLVKLDSGKQYRCECSLYSDPQENHLTVLNILEADTDSLIYPTTQWYQPFINRTVVPSTMEIIPEAIGTWADATKPSVPIVTFNEDGTCTILGSSGVWSLEYSIYPGSYLQDFPAGGGKLTAIINDNPYSINFNFYEDGRYDITVFNRDMAIVPHNTEIINIAEN